MAAEMSSFLAAKNFLIPAAGSNDGPDILYAHVS
ncbi:MAG: hypothetical protein QOG92_2631 [Verrucomicrobiota bacterium]|jgi:hypothetical protein|nr:hypothetical protein [Verrucomicrobiota bacterium]